MVLEPSSHINLCTSRSRSQPNFMEPGPQLPPRWPWAGERGDREARKGYVAGSGFGEGIGI